MNIRRHRALFAGLLAVAAIAAAPAVASGDQVTGLTLNTCFGTTPGCVNVAGDPFVGADGVAVSPNGSVYVIGESSAAPSRGFVSHLFGGPAGALSYDGCVSDDGDGGACADIPGTGKPLETAGAIAVSPNGRSVYVTSEVGFVDHLFADATGGQLTWDGCVSKDGSAGTCLNANEPGDESPFSIPSGIAVSPLASAPNASVYFASQGDDAISHLFADPQQGQLNWDGCLSDVTAPDCAGFTLPGNQPLANAFGVAVNPTGTAVYVTSPRGIVSQAAASPPDGGGLTAFVGCRDSDASNGCAQGPVVGNPLDGADGIAVSPDGASVYVASATAGTVSHFFADPTGTHLLSWDGCISDDGSGGACTKGPQTGTPLTGAIKLAVSPDGHTLYVVSRVQSSLSWFSIAPQGQLTFQGCLSDNAIPGCANPPGQPLQGAVSVAVSPDSGTVYVASPVGGTVASFAVQTAGSGGSGGSSGSGSGSGGSGGSGNSGGGSGGSGGSGNSGGGSGKNPGGGKTGNHPKQHLKLTYTPARPAAHKRIRMTFHVTYRNKPVRHATVSFDHRSARTSRGGHVTFTVRLAPGKHVAIATATGKPRTSAVVVARGR